jgi:hypothetical protein
MYEAHMSSTASSPDTQANFSANGVARLQGMALATAIRKQLCDTGYSPIPANGKRPALQGWQNKTITNAEEIEVWARIFPQAFNTGVLCAPTPTLDDDLRIPEAAATVEELVRDRFGERGRILVRFGLPPKRAILFRTAKPFAKILTRLIAPDGSTQQLEFLGSGQQIIVRGIHPDTRKPYSWHGGRPGDVHRDDLPEINEQEAQALIDDAAALVVRDHGYRISKAPKKLPGRHPGSQPRVNWSAVPDLIGSLHNDTATSIVGHLLRRNVDIGLARTLMQGWNKGCCVPPLPPNVIDTILNSIAAAELKRRGIHGK